MPLILGANSDTGAYEISNSLRFNRADSPKLSFNQGTPTSRRKWTYSTWVKRGNLKDQQESILSWGDEDFFDIRFQDGTPDDGLLVFISDGDSKTLATNRLFRDPSAWFHVIVASDTTDSTAGDRTRIYVNGVEETSFAAEAQPDQNYDYRGLVSGDPIVIGNRYTGSHHLDGYLADTNFIDGEQLSPSSFGETNDNGVWIPKRYSGNYGTNGFRLEYKQTGTDADANGLGADTSGNDNHMTVTNLAATDVTTDTPTNNFATLSSVNLFRDVALTEGNVQFDSNSSSGCAAVSTIAPSRGKWYAEAKIAPAASAGATVAVAVGVSEVGKVPYNVTGQGASRPVVNYAYGDNTNPNIEIDGSLIDTESQFRAGDIVGIALNLDDGEVTFLLNNTALNSGTAYNLHTNSTHDATGFSVQTHTGGGNQIVAFNFGNPSFAISSGNTDGKYGNFEFAPPSGYYALCTKRLAEFG